MASLQERVIIAAGAAVWAMEKGPLKGSSFAEERAMRFQEWYVATFPEHHVRTPRRYELAWRRYEARLEACITTPSFQGRGAA